MQIIYDLILKITGLLYEPAIHAIAAPVQRVVVKETKPEAPTPPKASGYYAGQPFVDDPAEKHFENPAQIPATPAAIKGRSPIVTTFDYDELLSRNLNTDNAILVKPGWAESKTAKANSRLLERIHGKNKGFGVRNCEDFHAAFNRALKKEQSPTAMGVPV